MQSFSSASECITWLVVFIIECLAIVIINIITIVVFVKRQLQRRSTYLIIHLTIVDFFVGVVSGPLQIENRMPKDCPRWKFRRETTWSRHISFAFVHLFSFTSLTNLIAISLERQIIIGMSQLCPLWNYRRKTIWSHRLSFAFVHVFSFISPTNLFAISLERLHATFCPFRHLFVRKGVPRAIIIVIWLIAIVREAAQIVLKGIADRAVINTYLYMLFYAVSLFIICVSYILITIKIRCSRHSQFHTRSKRERKLTGTTLIVSLVSLLCFLPAMIMIYAAWTRHSSTYFINVHIQMAVLVLFLANSLVNPIIYALRMPGFREGLLQVFCRVQDLSNAPANLPLRNLRRAKINGRKTINEVCF